MSRDLDMRNKLILKCTNCACLRSTGRSDQLHCTSLIVDHTEILENYHSLLSWSANGGSDSMTCCKLAALLYQSTRQLRICMHLHICMHVHCIHAWLSHMAEPDKVQ